MFHTTAINALRIKLNFIRYNVYTMIIICSNRNKRNNGCCVNQRKEGGKCTGIFLFLLGILLFLFIIFYSCKANCISQKYTKDSYFTIKTWRLLDRVFWRKLWKGLFAGSGEVWSFLSWTMQLQSKWNLSCTPWLPG